MRNRLSYLIILFVFIVLVVMSLFAPIHYNKEYLLFIIFIAIGGIIYPFIAGNDSISMYNIRPVLFFLLGYFIVFYQLYVDLLLGYTSARNTTFIDPDIINVSATYSTIGLYAFLIGYCGYIAKTKKYSDNSLPVIKYNLYPFCILFIIASFLRIFYSLKNMLSGIQYSQEMLENAAGGIQNYTSILFMTSFYALLAIHTNNLKGSNDISVKQYFRKLGLFTSICLFVCVIVQFLSGSRSPIIVILSGLAFSYFYVSKKRISWIKILFLFLIFSSVMMFVAIARVSTGLGIDEKYNLMQVRSLENNSIFIPSLEYASSLKTFNASLAYVPKEHDYLYGNFQFRSVLATIPFSSRIRNEFLNSEKKYSSSAFFVTHMIQGDNYLWGEGTSILADLYLDFGIIGIIIGMFLLGLFFRIIEYRVLSNNRLNIFYLGAGIVLMGNSFIYSRYAYLDFLNYIMFTLILIACFTLRKRV